MASIPRYEIDTEIGQLEIVAAETAAADLKLPEWGRWKRKGNSLRHLDYPPCVLSFRGRGSDAADRSAFIADISDEEGNRIELAIRTLDKPYRMLITAIYLSRTSIRDLAKFTRRSRQQIDHMHNRSLGMLSEKLR